MDSEPQTRIAAEDYLDALAANGIDHLFCNPGTDFAPIVEAFARAARTNRKVPRPMVVPHENAAMSMAHGYTMVTGKPQAVMLHTNVGTANAINMLIDASRDRMPVLLTSGRTPFTETGAEGSRSAHIHWAQEMYDQAGMLREMVKWDYEMKRGDQVATVVDRALELAMASPKGPVYLSLPREVLGEVVDDAGGEQSRASCPSARTGAVGRGHRATGRLDRERARAGGHHQSAGAGPARCCGAVAAGGALGTAGDPVQHAIFRDLGQPSDVPGFDAGATAGQCRPGDRASRPMCRGCRVRKQPPAGARVVQIGEDPLYARYPMRSFPSDLTITASALSVLEALEQALQGRADASSRSAARGWSRVRANCTRNGAMRRSGPGAATRTHRPG